jgi:hypothetical protein
MGLSGVTAVMGPQALYEKGARSHVSCAAGMSAQKEWQLASVDLGARPALSQTHSHTPVLHEATPSAGMLHVPPSMVVNSQVMHGGAMFDGGPRLALGEPHLVPAPSLSGSSGAWCAGASGWTVRGSDFSYR